MPSPIYRVKYSSRFEFSEGHEFVSSKVTLKTIDKTWIKAPSPSIILVSLDSLFHRGAVGGVKMKGLVKLIEENAGGPVEIYLADNAHYHTLTLCSKQPDQICLSALDTLRKRFSDVFENCRVLDSSEIINEASFSHFDTQLGHRYQSDEIFRNLVQEDAELSFECVKDKGIYERGKYVEAAIQDILEQCVIYCVFMEKGYRHLFYPGKHNASHFHYFRDSNLTLVNVFLALHNKKVLEHGLSHQIS